jgi:hypothetical protein
MNNINIFYIAVPLLLVIAVLFFVIRNLLNKVEKYEEDILMKDEFISKFKTMVEDSHKKIVDLDNKGAFESDDEVGHFFKSLKDLILMLGMYFKNYVVEEEAPPK